MKNFSKRALLVNIFGTLGYLFCLFSWLWVVLLYLPMLLENEQVGKFILPTPSQEPIVQAPASEASLLMIILAVAVTIFILIATVVILLRAPIAIARTGKTVTTKAASSAIPLITRGRQLPAAKTKRLTANLIKLVKLFLVLLPVCSILLGSFVELPLPFDIAILTSVILAFLALLGFSAQYMLALLLDVDSKKLV